MRIGFDITSLYVATGGVFWYDYNLAKALLEIDAQNDYVLVDYFPVHGGWTNPSEVASLQAPNCRTVRSHGFRHYKLSRWRPTQRPILRDIAQGVDRLLCWPLSAVSKRVMRAKLSAILDGVDVFHSSDVLLWAQPGARNVCTIHDLTALLFPELHTTENRELQDNKYRFARAEADIVIAVSEATRRDIVEHLNIPPERIRVVYNGVSPAFRPIEDQSYLEHVLAPLGLHPHDYILHVGTIEPRKNLIRLIHAYAKLREKAVESTPLLALVGATGWYYRKVFESVIELGLQDAVIFVGQTPASVLPAIYAGASLFIYPSLYEGFGLPPLEAMAAGVPVVTSNTSSLPEVVGDAAILVDPTDTGSLTEAMDSLLRDPRKCSSLRVAGLARAAQFSWQRTARETLDIYCELGGS